VTNISQSFYLQSGGKNQLAGVTVTVRIKSRLVTGDDGQVARRHEAVDNVSAASRLEPLVPADAPSHVPTQ